MDRIEDLRAFVAIVEKGSLTAAANQLGRSLQSVSRCLAGGRVAAQAATCLPPRRKQRLVITCALIAFVMEDFSVLPKETSAERVVVALAKLDGRRLPRRRGDQRLRLRSRRARPQMRRS